MFPEPISPISKVLDTEEQVKNEEEDTEPGHTEEKSIEPSKKEEEGTEPGKNEEEGTETCKKEEEGTEPGKNEEEGTKPSKKEEEGTEPGKNEEESTEPSKKEEGGTEPGKTEEEGKEERMPSFTSSVTVNVSRLFVISADAIVNHQRNVDTQPAPPPLPQFLCCIIKYVPDIYKVTSGFSFRIQSLINLI